MKSRRETANAICFYCADQNPHRDQSRGITNYTHGLLSSLADTGQVSLTAIVSKSSAGVPANIPKRTLPFRTDHVVGRLTADHFHPFLARDSASIWHYPKGFLPLGRQVLAKRVGTIADTILQFYADKYPHFRRRSAYYYWLEMLKNSIRNVDLILTISEFSRRAIAEFCERYSLQSPPVVVTYLGADIVDLTPRNEGPKEDYVLHMASSLPHKKTAWLLREWSILQREEKDLPQLRLVGELDPDSRALVSGARNITFSPVLSRADLASVVNKARALLLPSEIEGFGLPALEAYQTRTPVAFARGSAVEEIMGPDTPGAFTQEAGSLRAAVRAVLQMDASAVAAKRLELQERFSWKRCVERTLDAYSRVAPD